MDFDLNFVGQPLIPREGTSVAMFRLQGSNSIKGTGGAIEGRDEVADFSLSPSLTSDCSYGTLLLSKFPVFFHITGF